MRTIMRGLGLSVAAALWGGASAGLAAECDPAAAAGLPTLAAETTVRLDAPERIETGGRFTIDWARGPFPERYPAYLMIGFDKPVRAGGEGFYALAPGARAPFGITAFAEQSRIVIPYHGRGALRGGALTIRALSAGALTVSWAVVGHDLCQELRPQAGAGAATLRVRSIGRPEIVIDDDLSGAAPMRIIHSPDGDKIIEVYDGRWRLRDRASGASLAEHVGREPRFSPQGRYVAAKTEAGLAIVDSADNAILNEGSGESFAAWYLGDSYLALGAQPWGALSLINMGREPRSELWPDISSYACRACDGSLVSMRIDLDNNVLLVGDPWASAVSLTTPDTPKVDIGDVNDVDEVRLRLAQAVARLSQIPSVPLALPSGFANRHTTHGGSEEERRPPLIEPALTESSRREDAAAPLAAADRATAVARSRGFIPAGGPRSCAAALRGLVPRADAACGSALLRRLQEFGLPAAAPNLARAPERSLPAPEDYDEREAFNREIAGLIAADAPEAARALRPWERYPDEIGDLDLYPGGPRCHHVFAGLERGVVPQRFDAAHRLQAANTPVWLAQYMCWPEARGVEPSPVLTLFDPRDARPWTLDLGLESWPLPCSGADNLFAVEVSVIDERFLLLMFPDARRIALFDLETRRKLFDRNCAVRGDVMIDALFAPERDLLLQLNSDDTFVGYGVASQERLFEGRYVDDEIVVWTPEARFDATAEGAHYVSLRLPGQLGTFTFAQFAAQLRTPGLVERLRAGQRFEPLELHGPPRVSGALRREGGRLVGELRASGEAPLAALLLFQDGLLTDRLAAPAGAAFETVWTLDAAALPAVKGASVVVVDADGLASLPLKAPVAAAEVSETRRLHLVAVGVDHYEDPAIDDLGFARIDAEALAGTLGDARASGGVLASQALLLDGEARAGRVLRAIDDAVAAVAPGDTMVLFFSGHGLRDEDGAFFFATPDTSASDVSGTALAWARVAERLEAVKGRILVVLDTCHSGAAGDGLFATNDNASASLLERIPSGVVLISASKGRELAEESGALGGGVFTQALVSVLGAERGRFDLDQDANLSLSEVFLGVKRKVFDATEGRQTPWIARNQMVGDFVLF